MSTKNKLNSLSDNLKQNEGRLAPIRKDSIVKSGLWKRKRKDFKTKLGVKMTGLRIMRQC